MHIAQNWRYFQTFTTMASLALLSRNCWKAAKSPSFLRALSTSSVKLGGGGPATSALGGSFVENPGTPPSQEEISKWVEKEMEGNWQSYGYDYNDQKIDAQKNAVWMFALISIGMVCSIMVQAHRRTENTGIGPSGRPICCFGNAKPLAWNLLAAILLILRKCWIIFLLMKSWRRWESSSTSRSFSPATHWRLL